MHKCSFTFATYIKWIFYWYAILTTNITNLWAWSGHINLRIIQDYIIWVVLLLNSMFHFWRKFKRRNLNIFFLICLYFFRLNRNFMLVSNFPLNIITSLFLHLNFLRRSTLILCLNMQRHHLQFSIIHLYDVPLLELVFLHSWQTDLFLLPYLWFLGDQLPHVL